MDQKQTKKEKYSSTLLNSTFTTKTNIKRLNVIKH